MEWEISRDPERPARIGPIIQMIVRHSKTRMCDDGTFLLSMPCENVGELREQKRHMVNVFDEAIEEYEEVEHCLESL